MVHMIVKAGGRGHRIVFSSLTHCDQPQAVQGCVSSRRLCKESTRESSGSEMERSERGTASAGRRPLLSQHWPKATAFTALAEGHC